MPVYEYQCNSCGKRFSRFFWRFADAQDAACRCGSRDLERLISRVAMLQSEENRMDRLAESPELAGIDENDPRAMARMMRKMGQEMGEDLGPEFDEMVGRLESGEDPESIEASMGDMDSGSDPDDLF